MSALFGSTSKSSAETTSHETSLNVQSSVAGKVVAVVLGTKRVAGNLIWYGDFVANASSSSSGGKGGSSGSSSTTYTYTASVMVGLCVGEIQGINRVWDADDEVDLSGLGASVAVKTGAIGQSAWPWLMANHTAEALNYSGLAYIGIATADLGSSAALPNWNWEVLGLGTAKVTDDDGAYDIGFAEAISLVVENTRWGCGVTAALGDLSDYDLWCDAHGLYMSDDFSDAKSAREIIEEYCRATLAEPVWDGETLTIVPYADQEVIGDDATYTPDLTPVLVVDSSMLLPAEGDDEGPIKVIRKDPEEYFNYVSVEYHDRSDDYNSNTVTATDDAHIATYGQKPGTSLTAHFFHTAEMAQHSADLVQAKEIACAATYEFGLGPIGAIIRPMQIVWLNESEQGFENYPVRVLEISEEDSFQFRVSAEDVPGCAGAMVSRVVASGGQGYRSEYNKSPADCNAPIIFEAPAALTSGTGLEVWAAISGSDSRWGGCQVWISTDGDSYKLAGTVYGSARTGSLSADFASGDDPDTSNSVSVDLSESRASLLSGTQSDADLYSTLCYVGGELIAYQDATLTGTHSYTLGTYLRRGAYGTDIAAHASGARFCRLDSAIFKYPFTADMIGTTIYVKAMGFNQHQGGLQSLADVTAYSYTITGAEPPPTPTNFYADGTTATWDIADAPLDLAGTYIRHLAGRTRNWAQGTPWPSDGGIAAGRSLDLSQFGSGERTFMIRSVDTSGNLSEGTAFLTVGLGETAVENIILTYDVAAAGFPGTITGGAISDGVILADSADDAYLSDDNALYLPVIGDTYLPGSWGRVQYDVTYTPAATDTPGTLLISATISGDGWQIWYLRRGTNGLYLQNNDEAYLPDDDELYLGGPGPWTVWPGSLDLAAPETIDIRVVVEAGSRRGTVSALTIQIDVSDITESFEDLVIPAGGGRIPITKAYRVIDYVGTITLQDDGNGAVNVLVIDRDAALGPMLKGVNGSGDSVQATIDIKDLKGH